MSDCEITHDDISATLYHTYDADIRCGAFRIRWNLNYLLELIEEFCGDMGYQIQTRDDENNWVADDENECYRAFYNLEREQRWVQLMAGYLGQRLENEFGCLGYLGGHEPTPISEVMECILEFCDMPQYREHIRIVSSEE